MSEPRSFSDFKDIEWIARGTFGITYKCLRKSDEQQVCLKAISHSSRKRTVQEAEKLSRLNNRNIIKYFGSFVENDTFYIMMEYAPNKSLRHLILV